MTEYTLRVVKAMNGWVISSFDHKYPGSVALDTMVVQEDSDLAGMIAAALVSQRLKGVEQAAPPAKKTAPPPASRLAAMPHQRPILDAFIAEVENMVGGA
jgi:hypothetical protein